MAVILIVEDETKTGEYLRQGLREAGYVVDLAHNGTDGLHLALQQDYDLVILDVMLPGRNGWQILQEMRQRGRKMPAMFLSARDQVEDRIKGLELGAEDYLVKPFSFAELLARVRTHLDLKRSRDSLRRFAQEKQEMAELVAHDLRNYLANIMFATDLQIAIPDVDLGVVRLAHSIRSSADAGLLFLQALLEQQEEQASGGVIEPLSVRLLLGEAVDLLNESARAKRIMLQLMPHDAIVVSGLRSSAVHVLQNLLSNAIKYSPPGSRVSITASSKGTRGRMMVMDHGPGISGPDQERLFQRFTRLSSEPTGGETSTGLGLALAKQQARAMGGDLWYEKREGGGSIFTLELPLA